MITCTNRVDLEIHYSDKKVTPFGGMVLMKKFMDKLGIADVLDSLDLPLSGSNRGYDPKDIIHPELCIRIIKRRT
jgi:hypothetical protein